MTIRDDFDYENRFHIIDKIGNYTISTVDLGIDHSFGVGKPLYYETMIFKDDSWMELFCKRYSTKEEAIEGHKDAVELAKDGMKV